MKKIKSAGVLKQSGAFLTATIFFLSCMCMCIAGAYTVGSEQSETSENELKVVVKNAEVTASKGISGDCEVQFSDDTVSIDIDGFEMPGAYAELEITAENVGNLTAYLSDEQTVDCDIEGISVSFPTFSETEKIEPDEECGFAIVVSLDDTADSLVSKSGTFSMTLNYTNDTEESIPDESSQIPDDDTSTPDDISSALDNSSAPEITDNSSSQTDSLVTENSKPDSSSATSKAVENNSNVNTGSAAFYGFAAVFAMCALMCLAQLLGIRKNKDDGVDTDR